MGRRNKILIIAMLVMLLVAIPLTIIQSLNQQITKQRASNDYVILKAFSNNSSYDTGSRFEANIDLVNTFPDKKDISAIDITINYDKDVLKLVEFDTEGNYDFKTITKNTQTPGEIRFIGIRTDTLSEALSLFHVGTLAFEASNPSSGTSLSFPDVAINASEHAERIPFLPELQTYSITKTSSSVSAPTAIPQLPAGDGGKTGQTGKTDQKCAEFDSQGFATCKTPPSGNMYCWLPSCSKERHCVYQLNPLLKDDEKCSSLWISPNTNTPASAVIPTATTIPTLTPTPTPADSSSEADYNACVAPCNSLEDTTDALSCIQSCTKFTY